MKKIISILFLVSLLVGCGSSPNVSLSDYETAFVNEGLIVEEEKPLFGMIGAKDGFILYQDGQKVAVYEFANEKDIKKAEDSMPAIKDWVRNGTFVIETSSEEAKKIFNNVK